MSLFREIPCPRCAATGVERREVTTRPDGPSLVVTVTCLKCEGSGEAWRFLTPAEVAAEADAARRRH